MNIKYKSIAILIILSIVTFMLGCSDESKEGNTLAYISHSKSSDYEKMFDDLQLGRIFDYEYELVNGDKTWIEGWLEVYENGKIVNDNIGGFKYMTRPNKNKEEGSLGFGVINSVNDNSSFFFFSPAFRMTPNNIEYDLNKSDGINIWHNAINDQTLTIKKDEAVVLAVYREVKGNELRKYNYQNSDAIEKIIKDDNRVILFKFKISE